MVVAGAGKRASHVGEELPEDLVDRGALADHRKRHADDLVAHHVLADVELRDEVPRPRVEDLRDDEAVLRRKVAPEPVEPRLGEACGPPLVDGVLHQAPLPRAELRLCVLALYLPDL